MYKLLYYNGKVISALQWNGVNISEVEEFAGDALLKPHLCMGFLYLYIKTPDGILQCNEGDWIAKATEGKFYVISNEELSAK